MTEETKEQPAIEHVPQPTAAQPAPGEPTSTSAQAEEPAQQEEAPAGPVEEVSFKIQFGKGSSDVKRPYDSLVGELKDLIEQQTGIPSKLQKLMCKGAALKEDDKTLRQAGVKAGSKLLLIGSGAAAVDAAKQGAAAAAGAAGWEEGKASEEPVHTQTQHAKILAKGLPDGAMAGIAGRQVTLDTKVTPSIPALLNSQGTKVRLTFKEELQQLWIGSDTSTQKVPYSTISKIESWPIPDKEGYSILAMTVGAGGTSRYWLYYYPSQYVAALKIRVLGVQSLI